MTSPVAREPYLKAFVIFAGDISDVLPGKIRVGILPKNLFVVHKM